MPYYGAAAGCPAPLRMPLYGLAHACPHMGLAQASCVLGAAEAALPQTEAGLQKAVMVTLKAVLAARGLDTSGQKAQLVARVLSVLQGDGS